MKIALLTSGQARGLKFAVETWSFLPQVADVFWCASTPDDAKEFTELLPASIGITEPDMPGFHMFSSDKGLDRRTYHKHNPGVILALHWWTRKKAFELIPDPAQYDLILYVRPDSYFLMGLHLDPSRLRPAKFWTPRGHNWGAINDHVAVGSPAMMAHYCNTWNSLGKEYQWEVGNMEERLLVHMMELLKPEQFGLLTCGYAPITADGEIRVPLGDRPYFLPKYSWLQFAEVI